MNGNTRAIRDYLAAIGSKGGKARAAKHDKNTLSNWGKLGGRPKKRMKGRDTTVRSK